MSNPIEYLTAEVSGLRAEIINLSNRTEKQRFFAIALSSAFWSWWATSPSIESPEFVQWIPLFSVVLLGLRHVVHSITIRNIASYIIKVESHLLETDKLGWEHNCRKQREKKDLTRPHRLWDYTFWLFLMITNISIPLFEVF